MHYDKLMETRKSRVPEASVYYETHHVVMKSMGGTDDPENLVKLTAREHFLAHWLLWRIHRNRETAYAFGAFRGFFAGKNHENRPTLTLSARAYAEAKEAYVKAHSERLTGALNSNRSKRVLQYTLDGEFVKEWPSAAEARRETGACHITACCRGERPFSGNFLWSYANPELKKSKPYKKREHTKTYIPVYTEKRTMSLKKRKWYNDGEKVHFLHEFLAKQMIEKGVPLRLGRKINSCA